MPVYPGAFDLTPSTSPHLVIFPSLLGTNSHLIGVFPHKNEEIPLCTNYAEIGIIKIRYESPLAELSHSVILGSTEFVDVIKDRFLKGRKTDRELPALNEITKRLRLDHIEQVVDSALQPDEKLARQVKLYVCHHYSGNVHKSLYPLTDRAMLISHITFGNMYI